MASLKRLGSSLLFAGGLMLVFAGLSAALGFTIIGILASLAVVAALLYAGGVWFGAPSDPPPPVVFVFDRDLRITVGPSAGLRVTSQFPEPMHAEIERRCLSAISGHHSRFVCSERTFDAAPVLTGHPSSVCAVLVEGAVSTVRAGADVAPVGVL
jgi:hypothetical protein